jgi:type I restriction enzyme S subunit
VATKIHIKPYPSMEQSGVPWVGEVPSHWTRSKLRTLLERVAERNRPDLPLLSVVREKGVILRDLSKSDDNHNFIPDDLTNYKRVRRGQFAMNKMKAWQGSYGVSDHEGIVSPAYFVFDLQGVDGRFLHAAIRSRAYVPFFTQASDGVRIGQWDLSDSRMREIPFFVPPLAEQAAIVRFLDHADRRIRRYIRAKQRLIKLLEEQKQAIIDRTVTRGLDRSVRLKLADVEGLPYVPEHWAVHSFTRLAIEKADYRGATPTKTESGVFLVTARNVRKGWLDYKVSQEFVAQSEYQDIMRRGLPKIGDLLMTMEAPLGHAALVDREDVALAQRVVRFRFDPCALLPRFVLLSVLSRYFQDQLLRRGTGSTALGIKASKLPQLRLLVPPVEEQQRLLDYIDRECKPLDAAAVRARTEIELLREYRTRLISDVVTGKADVREAAARLPEDASDAETIDETDGEVEGEESAAQVEAVSEEAGA